MNNLENLTDEQLAAELKKRREKKQNDKDAMEQLIAETVPSVALKLIAASEQLQHAKVNAFQAFSDIIALKGGVYGVKNDQQSHTFSTDNQSIRIGYRVNDSWGDSTAAGITIVNEFIQSLAKDQNSAMLVEALTDYMKPDRNGNLKASRVLEMQKWAAKQNHPRLTEGIELIIAGHKLVRSNWFVECQVKNDRGVMENVPLAISSVEFPADFSFEFLNPKSDDNV